MTDFMNVAMNAPVNAPVNVAETQSAATLPAPQDFLAVTNTRLSRKYPFDSLRVVGDSFVVPASGEEHVTSNGKTSTPYTRLFHAMRAYSFRSEEKFSMGITQEQDGDALVYRVWRRS